MDVHSTAMVAAVIVVFITISILISQQSCKCSRSKKVVDHFDDGNMFSKDSFDVYLINMKKNVERLNSFVDQYKASDLNFKNFFRFEAVDGRALNLKDYVSPRAYQEITEAEQTGYRKKHYQLTPGGVGCYLSHQSLLRIIRDSDKQYGIIFEDDATIDPTIYSKLSKVALEMPTDWDILLLGCFCLRCVKYETYSDIKRFFFLHGYIVKRESAKKILEYMDKLLIEQQIDTVWSDMAAKGIIKILCLNNSLAKQDNSFGTTIQLPMRYEEGVDPFEILQLQKQSEEGAELIQAV